MGICVAAAAALVLAGACGSAHYSITATVAMASPAPGTERQSKKGTSDQQGNRRTAAAP
jgi:hypothetical protein